MPDNEEIKKTAEIKEMKKEALPDEIMDQVNGGLVVRREKDPEPRSGKTQMRGSWEPPVHVMI